MKVFKLLLTIALLTVSLTVGATVRMAPDGITADPSRSGLRRGAETLYPVRIDRRWVEESVGLGGLWLPSTGSTPVLARYVRTLLSQDGNWTWIGKIDTRIGEQSVILTFGDHAVFGTIPQTSGLPLRIETRHGHSWLVEGSLPTRRLPQGHSDGLIASIPGAESVPKTATLTGQLSDGNAHAATANPVVIDVLVVYTPSVVTYYGSDSAARTRLDFLASVANQAYADASVNQQIRIVSKQLLNYTTANDNGPLLDLITNSSADPVKTQIDSWRSQYGADLVSVVRAYDNASQTNCGLAWIGGYHGNPYIAQYGFSVLGDGSNGGYYCHDVTFAHELGHNMGCAHDYTTDSGDYGAYTYSRGFRQTIDSNTGFATVMAYSVDPQVILSIFSNPNLNNCMGQPCGVPDGDPQAADNAHTLTNSGPSVAAFLATVVPAVPTLSISDVSISEGNSGTKVATFTVELSTTSGSAVTYDIATADNSATAGSDYVANGLIGESIPAGQTIKTFAVTINGDSTVEANESFFVNVGNVVGATVADGQALGTISNDDVVIPTLSIADVSITEGNSGTQLMTFTATLSQVSTSNVSFSVATANGSATAGSDYVALPLTNEVIPAGQPSKTFTVTINGDATVEANEVFNVDGYSPVNATFARSHALGTILSDELPTLSIADVSITEGNSGTKLMTFTATLSQAVTGAVSFGVATANGSATAGSDYVAVPLTNKSIPTGQTSRTFTVTINGDAAVEANEVFNVNGFSPVNATFARSHALGTITSDELPTLSIADVSITEGNSGTKLMTFTATLSQAVTAAVSFGVATANGSATGGSDYVVLPLTNKSIAIGQTSKTFTVTINGDTTVEGNEVFNVNGFSPVNATFADSHALGTITNDD